MLKLVLFDLDGTVMDTAPELTDALNDTLARHGLPSVEEDRVRGWIGDGAQALLGKALNHVGALPGHRVVELAEAWAGFSFDYRQRCGTHSTVHRGVRTALRWLRAQGIACALLTNKEGAFAHKLLVAHELTDSFDLIVAGDSLPVKKPDPAVVFHALDALHCAPEDALLVGDSIVDVRTARNAGVPVWLVTHGYCNGDPVGADAPDRFIDSFDDFDPLHPGAGLTASRLSIAAAA